jgi:dipeptidyl aminopeptidase/acylaminoacyl peptidase
VIIHGKLDRQVPLELSRRYATAAGSVGADVRLVETSTEHFSLIDPEARIWPTVVAGLQSVFG